MRLLVIFVRNSRAGNLTFTRGLLNELGKRPGLDIQVLVGPANAHHLESIGWPAERTHLCNAGTTMRIFLEWYCSWKLAKQLKPEIIYFANNLNPCIPLPKASRSVVLITDLNFTTLPVGWARRFYKYLLYCYAKLMSDGLAYISNYAKTEMKRLPGTHKAKDCVISSGLDQGFLDAGAAKRQGRTPTLLAFCHYKHKNVGSALEVLTALNASGTPFSLKLIGDPYDRNEIKRLITDRCSGQVTLLGHISSARLQQLYSESAALLFLSHYEGLGLPVLEAMTLGALVCVSDHPALLETANGHAVVHKGIPAETATAIRRYWENEEVYNRHTEKAAQYAGRHTWEATANRLLDFCDELISG